MDYLNFRNTKKRSISEFNLEEIRGWIIDRMAQIEMKIDHIITEHFQPKNRDEFKRVVLNSSILNMGAKSKILKNISKFDKTVLGKIQKISSIRNAFAHLPLSEHIAINIIQDTNGEDVNTEVKVTSIIEVMTSSGELRIENSQHKILEFFKLQDEIIIYLNNFTKD